MQFTDNDGSVNCSYLKTVLYKVMITGFISLPYYLNNVYWFFHISIMNCLGVENVEI